MEYEALLESAYEKVEPVEECGRFEILKVKGHHEGIRTIITNFLQVANCLRRRPLHLLKFLNKELASSGEIKGERLILSRKLPSSKVNEKVERYAHEFVICRKCKKPDTEIIDDNGKTVLKCLACGEKRLIHKI